MMVYLAGPIADMTDTQAGGWRTDMTRSLAIYGVETLDPFVRRDYRGKRDYDPAEVVEADKADIRASDVLLANCHAVSVGTSQEVMYAWEQKKHVVIMHPDPDGASPWLRYHSHRMISLLPDGYALALLHILNWFS